MTSLRSAVVAVVISLAAACGGEPDEAPPAAEPSPSESSTEPSPSVSESTSEEPGETRALTGVVGQEGDPDAFVITLMDGSGNEVTNLPAGEYEVQVTDLSSIHNFHLTGPGVEESTTVPETTQITWTVTLEAGAYTFRCDPHRPMVGTFTVT